MILNFFLQLFLQSFLGTVFLGGLVGIGLIFLRVFKIEKVNTPIALALSFFISLCTYVAGATIFLFLVKGNSLLVLKIFSLAYIICSYSILGYFLLKINLANKVFLTTFVRKYGIVFLSLLFIVFIFFLGAYKTALVDEWLHRPVVKFFVTNGEFPLKNPFNPHDNFIQQYHYGLYIPGSAIQLLTNIGVSESLDVMKIGFVIASFLFLYGLLFEWSRRKYFSIVGSVFLLLSGPSFFFIDGFSTHYWYWFKTVEQLETMNYPFLYALLGITWVNLPLTLAFMIIAKKLFYDNTSYSFGVINCFMFLLVGYFLISELFAVFIILCLFVLTVHNILKRNISLVRAAVLSAFFVLVIAAGIYFSEGVVVGALKNIGASSFLSLRNISSWGYPESTGIISPVADWFFYLRNFLLEIIIAAILLYGLFRKKITIGQQPLMFFGLLVTFIVPFIFSTPMGNQNLYKLTIFGLILLHLLFFYYFSNHRRTPVFFLVIGLFVFGSVPLVFSNYHVRRGDTAIGSFFRCIQSDLCYDKSSVDVLTKMEENSQGIKFVLAAPADAQEVVDIANAYALSYSGILNSDYLEQLKVQYIFVTPRLRMMLNEQSLKYLDQLDKIAEKGGFEVLCTECKERSNFLTANPQD